MAENVSERIEELYRPSAEVMAQAHVADWEGMAARAGKDFVGFWEEKARELIDWHSPWTKVLDDSNKPFYKWFTGARTNIVYNAIDRHLKGAYRNKLALIWEGES